MRGRYPLTAVVRQNAPAMLISVPIGQNGSAEESPAVGSLRPVPRQALIDLFIAMSLATLYHNPQCSTSRKALDLLREHGCEPQIVEYLKHPPDQPTLEALIAASGRPVSDFVRRKEALFDELNLGAIGVTDAQRISALIAHPKLLERPIVVTALGTRLGRPLESVLDILSPAA